MSDEPWDRRVNVRMPESLYNRMLALAEANLESMSGFIRRAVAGRVASMTVLGDMDRRVLAARDREEDER